MLFPATLCQEFSAPNSRLISLQSENVEINPACYWQQHSTVIQSSLPENWFLSVIDTDRKEVKIKIVSLVYCNHVIE